MSIIDLQESLKDVSDDGLMKAFRSGSAPQFLILSELQRRKRMRDEYKRQQAASEPTVAEEMITGAGVPQEGLMAMAGAMAPNTNVAQDTGLAQAMPMQPTRAPQPQMAADGGLMNFASGGAISVQPTGGGNYILVQDGERVQGTGVYSDFESADAASRAIRDAQPFQVPRILADKGLAPSPIAMDEGPSLQEIDPDPMSFIANDEVRRELQKRQASGMRGDPRLNMDTAGGLGRAFFDENVLSIPSQTDDIASSMVADPRLPVRGADTDASKELAEFLASRRSDLPGVNLPGDSYPYEIDPDAARRAGESFSVSDQLIAQGFTGGDIDPSMAPTNLQSDLANALRFAVENDNASPTAPTVSGAFPNDAELALQSFPNRKRSIAPIDRDDFVPIPNEKGSIAPIDREGKPYTPNPDKTGPSGLKATDPFYPELPIPASDVEAPVTIAEDAERLAEDNIAPKADEYRGDDPLTFIDSVTDGGADGAGFGSIESEMAKMLSDRRKRADQNKWLALAEAGFAMMGPAATFGQGIAKGGQAGLKALRESQKGLDAFETDMLKLQTQLDIARQTSADRRYGADTRADTSRYVADTGLKGQRLSAEARSKATQQRLSAQTDKSLSDLVAIYDNQLAELGVISGQAPPAAVADRYNQIIRERQAVIDELERRVVANVGATGGSELFGVFDVPPST